MSVRWEIAKKELKGCYRRKSVVASMAIMVVLFITVVATSLVEAVKDTLTYSELNNLVDTELSLALIIPAVLSAQSAVLAFPGERDTKTLEYLLAMPLKDSELILGKFGAALLLGLVGEIVIFGLILGLSPVLASNAIADATYPGPSIWLIVFLIAPLFTALAASAVIVASLHITSTRAVSFLATLPVALTAFGLFILKSEMDMNAVVVNGIIAGALAVAVAIAYLVGVRSFSREKLVTKI